MFTELYLRTTNPELSFEQVFSADILFKVMLVAVFHSIVYTAAFNVASLVFLGKPLGKTVNARLFVTLLIIMSFGYLARFFHVKDVYTAYQFDLDKTREHLDKLYIGWIFIA